MGDRSSAPSSQSPAPNAPARLVVSQSTAIAPGERSWVELGGGSRTDFGSDFGTHDLPSSSAADMQWTEAGLSLAVLSASNSLRAARVADEDGGEVRLGNLRTVAVALASTRDSTVAVVDVKRGRSTHWRGQRCRHRPRLLC